MKHISSDRRIFLCHSSNDKDKVRTLYNRLMDDGFKPWLDEEDLLPGQDWKETIVYAVESSTVVLVCLSRSSITKTGYVQKEIKFALERSDEQPEGKIFIIPVRLEQCNVPRRLNRWQYVDLFHEKGYSKLLKALEQATGKSSFVRNNELERESADDEVSIGQEIIVNSPKESNEIRTAQEFLHEKDEELKISALNEVEGNQIELNSIDKQEIDEKESDIWRGEVPLSEGCHLISEVVVTKLHDIFFVEEKSINHLETGNSEKIQQIVMLKWNIKKKRHSYPIYLAKARSVSLYERGIGIDTAYNVEIIQFKFDKRANILSWIIEKYEKVLHPFDGHSIKNMKKEAYSYDTLNRKFIEI